MKSMNRQRPEFGLRGAASLATLVMAGHLAACSDEKTSSDAGAVDASMSAASEGDGEAPDGGEDSASKKGVFGASPVSGLAFSSASASGKTNDDGKFSYADGEEVSFAIGDLPLGSATGAASLTVVDLVGASDIDDPKATNRLVLLQSLDQDGDLNNGTQISAEIADIVSSYKDKISFDQAPDAFAKDTNLTALLAELNAADVFTDTDPRERKVRKFAPARAYFARATAERKEVATEYGKVRGYAANKTTWQWLGVPYAKPPLGELRWKPPAEPEAWSKPRDAVAWSDQAAQDPALAAAGEGGMSEDSLYLNVTAPKDAKDLPVMVWFHGGAFTILTGNSLGYNNPDGLTNKGVVLVVVNHRLGPFGYLAHPLLAKEASYGGSGNYGQMDLVQALTWVKNNIAKFGGDPDSVTIFGQSGGCGKANSLLFSPMAKGLFHKVICESGNAPAETDATPEKVIADTEAVGTAMFERLKVSTLEDARALPWTAIVQADIDAKIPREIYRPTIDNHYMSKTYYQTYQDGLPNKVPVMLGVTQGDYSTLLKGFKAALPQRAMFVDTPLYPYIASTVPTGWVDRDILAGHGGELPFLFNYPPMFANNYAFNLVLDKSGMKPPIEDLNNNGVTGTQGDAQDVIASLEWGDMDRAVSDNLMTIWTNFAKTGKPNTDTLDWTPYTVENDTYVELSNTGATVKTGLQAALDAKLPEVQAP